MSSLREAMAEKEVELKTMVSETMKQKTEIGKLGKDLSATTKELQAGRQRLNNLTPLLQAASQITALISRNNPTNTREGAAGSDSTIIPKSESH